MADDKKTNIFGKDKIVLQAKPGYSLPVRYRGAWVRVTKDQAVEFVVAELAYETKIEIKAAVEAEHVEQLTALPALKPEPAKTPVKEKAAVAAKAEAAPAPKAKET